MTEVNPFELEPGFHQAPLYENLGASAIELRRREFRLQPELPRAIGYSALTGAEYGLALAGQATANTAADTVNALLFAPTYRSQTS